MDILQTKVLAAEPESWILVFSRESRVWWVKLLARGRFNHVKAFGYVPATDSWLFVDLGIQRLAIVSLPNTAAADRYFFDFTRDTEMLRFRPIASERHRLHPGLWCVPAIKHLIGLRSGALLPSRLWEDCLAAGGEPILG